MSAKSCAFIITQGVRLKTASGKEFDVTPMFCSNPKCKGNEVELYFHEAESTFRKKLFRLVLNCKTWRLISTELYANDDDYPKEIHEFVSDLSCDSGDDFRSFVRQMKKELAAKRYQLKEDIDSSKLDPKMLVHFDKVYFDSVRPQLVFEHEGQLYFATDHYCANPSCKCKKAHLDFQLIVDNVAGEAAILSYEIDFGSNEISCKHRAEGMSSELVQQMFEAFADFIIEDIVHFFVKRQELIQKWGRNAFANSNESKRVAAKVGRNEFCPCGSGKKFKKCCL